MRKILFTLCCFLLLQSSQAQDYNSFESIKLETKADYTPGVEMSVLQACQLLLSTPLEKQNMARLKSAQFLIRWMSGIPTHSFEIGGTAGKISKSNEDLLLIYLAAMTQYSLENPEHSKDAQMVQLQSVKGVLAYCQSQQLKLTGELERLHAAQQKGELEKYLSK